MRQQFWQEVRVTGTPHEINSELEKARWVADFLALGELMFHDTLYRNESCGAHFREEYQPPDGEALRDDRNYLGTRRDVRLTQCAKCAN